LIHVLGNPTEEELAAITIALSQRSGVEGPPQASAWALANRYPDATFDELVGLVRCSARSS
jgi:hypothetical protein